ncbi:EH signature domain-containing protein [Altericroceibacterium xinjiangense]|uniref:EH signature domain-containing protein n=1 Tax=Altericroceibacterium xinjiangense TaxID=762261 RepID=UPI0019D2F5F7|nr:EH signature domain-containing protein [Altericroceibacterium xinjiangense]
MSGMNAAIARMVALARAGFPQSPGVQTRVEKGFASLSEVSAVPAEDVVELKPFLAGAQGVGVPALRRSPFNRVLRGAWCDPEFDRLGLNALDRAVEESRRSSDQAVIEGYLSWFPVGRPAMDQLASAAELVSQRHAWPWRERQQRWQLFCPALGPVQIAQDFVTREADGIGPLVREAGLGTNMNATAFGQAAYVQSCLATAALRGEAAVKPQRNLLQLFDGEAQAGHLTELARALLEPWVNGKPDKAHRKAISDFLVDQVGDPRLSRVRWGQIVDALAQTVGREQALAVMQVLKRWLTDVAMREFFRAIAKTTNRPDQWAQREKFWLAYLDAELVTDAWPALGARARQEVEDIFRASGERVDYGVIHGGVAASSSIIMQIGDLRISEWSDNGSCRFWSSADPKAAKLYANTYDGGHLRTTVGRRDFERKSHAGSWPATFAQLIHNRTGISHPVHGVGWGY